ncbi:MAG: alpha/beta fold hydrolase [Akkermansiaceae bacterium]|nr:alpha/beta fold hydrolase [Akkermansiaceae bacterium]
MLNSFFKRGVSVKILVTLAWGLLLSSCSTAISFAPTVKGTPQLKKDHFISYDDERFGYRKWLPQSAEFRDPDLVIIGVHGISGHAGDYENLAKYLLGCRHDVALYAAETRGQGMDSKHKRRGDIRRVEQWYDDLLTFTKLVRQEHPKSKIIWFGESMGSLIIMHAYQRAQHELRPYAMAISSPIIEVDSELPWWKLAAAKCAAVFFPGAKISLESLSDGRRPVVTKKDQHEQQAAKNAWYIRRYTLRLLVKLGDMAQSMDEMASAVSCPVLVMHGDKDVFTQQDKVNDFCNHFDPLISKTRHDYTGSYHLLMYDHQKDKIFADISTWLNQHLDGNNGGK